MIFHFSVSEQKLLLGLDKSLKTMVGTFLQEIVMDDTLTPGAGWGSCDKSVCESLVCVCVET